MPNSLNATLNVLGRILDEPPNTLRTRQRALVALQLFNSIPGKGPGSGVVATPRTLAQFSDRQLHGSGKTLATWRGPDMPTGNVH